MVANVAAHGPIVCSVTIEEQIGGWSALARSAVTPADHEHAAVFLVTLVRSWAGFALAPFNASADGRFRGLVRAKLNVKRNDLRIAAVALEMGAVIVTRNRRDFGRVTGLILEDWSV